MLFFLETSKDKTKLFSVSFFPEPILELFYYKHPKMVKEISNFSKVSKDAPEALKVFQNHLKFI